MYLTVRLDRENQRFYTTINNLDYELRYKVISPKVFEFTYLLVNEDQALINQEVEEELMYSAFLFAQKEGITVIPGCDRVLSYLVKHKEFTCVTLQEQSA